MVKSSIRMLAAAKQSKGNERVVAVFVEQIN